MTQIGPFSYRVQIRVEPNWTEIIKRVVGLQNESEQMAFGKKLKDSLPDSDDSDDRMLNRSYDFTEFFDSQSGLTTRFQRVHANGQIYGGFVKEFADAGYLFGRNSPLAPEDQKRKHQIAVTERGISTECFDEYSGQFLPIGRSLFQFPTDLVVEFGVALQLRFPHITTSHVIRWPERISAVLQEESTKYEYMLDGYIPKEFDLEKEDREFFSRYGNPKVATRAIWPGPFFEHPCCYVHVELEVFTPQSASRFASSYFGSVSLPDISGRTDHPSAPSTETRKKWWWRKSTGR